MLAMPLLPKMQADVSRYLRLHTHIARDQHNLHDLQAAAPLANEVNVHPTALTLKFVCDPGG